MDYTTTIEDTYGDKAAVTGNTIDGHVYIETEAAGESTTLELTPKRARKMAAALIEAAAVTEGRFGE